VALLVGGETLGEVWLAALAAVSAPGVSILRPLVATISGFESDSQVKDSAAIRTKANHYLSQIGAPDVEVTARLIFPISYWNPVKPRADLFARFDRAYPKIQKASPKNAYGTYFRRLTSYEGAPANGNQLEHIIGLANNGITRGSALQAAVFDPRKDLAGQAMRGFPCLQQLMFTVDGGMATATGVYARQYIDARGYGNYLGLCWLARFFAHEVGLPLRSVVCVATAASLTASKHAATDLLSQFPPAQGT
jgi:hypothetical protein